MIDIRIGLIGCGLALILANDWLLASESSAPDATIEEDLSWPKTGLGQDGFKAVIALPHPENGFYKGSRFEQSAFVYRLQVNDLTLFGPWKRGFRLGGNDAVAGPAGEFGMDSPLGFDEAKPGEAFIKIGVGHLLRPDDAGYSFTKSYKVLDRGEWKIEQGDGFLESEHELSALRGWAYFFRKRIELIPPATLKITYTLKNTGEKEINTNFYNHNFFVFNNEMVAEGDQIEILADTSGPKMPPPAQLHHRRIEFTGPILPNRGYFLEMPLPSKLLDPTLARILHKKSGSSVTIQSDCPPYKLVIYAHDKALCAEPFLKIDLKPGEEKVWSDSYLIETASGQ